MIKLSKKLVNFRLKEEIWEEFQKKSDQEGKSASAQLRNLINQFLEQDEQDSKQIDKLKNQLIKLRKQQQEQSKQHREQIESLREQLQDQQEQIKSIQQKQNQGILDILF